MISFDQVHTTATCDAGPMSRGGLDPASSNPSAPLRVGGDVRTTDRDVSRGTVGRAEPTSRNRTRRETITMLVAAVMAAVVLGYLGGLLSFKIKSRWCPECGATTIDAIPRNAKRTL